MTVQHWHAGFFFSLSLFIVYAATSISCLLYNSVAWIYSSVRQAQLQIEAVGLMIMYINTMTQRRDSRNLKILHPGKKMLP